MPHEAPGTPEGRTRSEVGHFGLTTMHFVYLIQSLSHPKKRYIGVTTTLDVRLSEHNAGKSPFTSHFKPWKLIAAVAFDDRKKAETFERYMKTGSGWAFANRHFW